MRPAWPRRPAGQTWAACVRNHAADVRACDFLQLCELWFRPPYAYFVIALGSRRVVHVGVTRHPTDVGVAQQLREAPPFGQRPMYLIRGLILGERHLRRVLRAYIASFNHARPHQGIGQAILAGSTHAARPGAGGGRVVAFPILGGLRHAYRRAA